jgi:hypothetical protein
MGSVPKLHLFKRCKRYRKASITVITIFLKPAECSKSVFNFPFVNHNKTCTNNHSSECRLPVPHENTLKVNSEMCSHCSTSALMPVARI